MSPVEWVILLVAALVASTVAAIAGTGGGVILLPVMTAIFGVREAVPMYAIAQLIGNLSRVYFNRRELEIRVVGWFALGAVPAAVLGALAFAHADESLLIRLLGVFLLLIVAARRLRADERQGFSARWFTPIGAVFAFVSALVGSAGPFLAPFYLSYGLVRGGFIGTEALGTALMHVVKLATYQGTGILGSTAVTIGLALGPIMVLGSHFGKRAVDRIPPKVFIWMIDILVACFGLLFLIRG